jgi:imidazolonepropionase-like amidohydrolase
VRETLGVRNALVFDGESAEVSEASIRIADGRIVELGNVTGGADRVVEAEGRVVTPGLLDAHFHAYAIALVSAPIERALLSYVALVGQHGLTDALCRGFTTVRDPAGGDAGLARAIQPSPAGGRRCPSNRIRTPTGWRFAAQTSW